MSSRRLTISAESARISREASTIPNACNCVHRGCCCANTATCAMKARSITSKAANGSVCLSTTSCCRSRATPLPNCAMAAGGQIPPPLVDSPKCPRCSLVTICLPDEVQFLHHPDLSPRPLAVPTHEALPLYIQQYNAKLTKKGETLEVSKDEQVIATARLREVSQVVIQGSVYVTTPCLQELMRRDIPVTWHSYGGFFFGHTLGNGHKNVELRTAQYRASFDEKRCLRLARGFVAAKIANCRTQLRRNWKPEEKPEQLLADL